LSFPRQRESRVVPPSFLDPLRGHDTDKPLSLSFPADMAIILEQSS
jgi:hypothetical protein